MTIDRGPAASSVLHEERGRSIIEVAESQGAEAVTSDENPS